VKRESSEKGNEVNEVNEESGYGELMREREECVRVVQLRNRRVWSLQ
jgi:hypothetical protein